MRRQPAKEIPRWRRAKATTTAPQQVIQLRGRNARMFTREVARLSQEPGRKEPASRQSAANDLLATTGAWRFRRHLAPFAWLLFLMACSALRFAPHPLLCGLAASIAIPGVMVLFTRHLKPAARRAVDVAALFTSAWLPFLATLGLQSCLVWLLVTWAPLAALWIRRCQWRPVAREETPEIPGDDLLLWDRLAAKRKWTGRLTAPEEIPGGRKWQIQLDGVETHIGQVIAEPRAIAAAWGRARTEVYVEPHPTAIESRGVLTILDRGTLESVVSWDGNGFDASGIARIGRFADGQPVRIRAFNPRNGTVHSLIAGTTGAGKSVALDDLIWIALNSEVPVVPIILDPQNGQSLPQWQGKVLYAAGIEECVAMVRAMDIAMDERSRHLAGLTWDDDGHKVKGMNFFDPTLSGLPIIMPIYEEAPQLLNGDGHAKLGAEMTQKTAKKGKLGRKAGEALQLVAQIPSLAELGGDQALRAMLAGGNVISLRTAERVSAGMLGLDADPSALPKYFPDGAPTAGLGYAVSVDNRQAPMRIDRPDRDPRREDWPMVLPDDRYMEAMNRILDRLSPTSTVAPVTGTPAAQPSETADETPEGRRCIDAVWLVLSDRGTEMTRGDIIQWVNDLATGAWGREKPFTIKAIGNALRDLVDGKDAARPVVKPKDGVYQAGSVAERSGS